MDGINAARLTIPQARFDAARCGRGLECLRNYQAEWDEQLRTFKRTPKHDWASHGANSWRYLSMSWREPVPADEETDPIAELLKPRTWDDVWREYAEERIEAGADPELLELE